MSPHTPKMSREKLSSSPALSPDIFSDEDDENGNRNSFLMTPRQSVSENHQSPFVPETPEDRLSKLTSSPSTVIIPETPEDDDNSVNVNTVFSPVSHTVQCINPALLASQIKNHAGLILASIPAILEQRSFLHLNKDENKNFSNHVMSNVDSNDNDEALQTLVRSTSNLSVTDREARQNNLTEPIPNCNPSDPSLLSRSSFSDSPLLRRRYRRIQLIEDSSGSDTFDVSEVARGKKRKRTHKDINEYFTKRQRSNNDDYQEDGVDNGDGRGDAEPGASDQALDDCQMIGGSEQLLRSISNLSVSEVSRGNKRKRVDGDVDERYQKRHRSNDNDFHDDDSENDIDNGNDEDNDVDDIDDDEGGDNNDYNDGSNAGNEHSEDSTNEDGGHEGQGNGIPDDERRHPENNRPAGENTRQRNKEADPSKWRQNKRRTDRNLGREYEKVRKDPAGQPRIQPAKELGPPCTCPKNCWKEIPEDLRQQHFENFYKLGDYNKQNQLLVMLVKQIDKARQRTDAEESRREKTLIWHMKRGDELIKVCKIFFLNTFVVSDKRVRTAIEKMERSTTGIPSPDRRGKHPPGIKLPESTHNFIIDHIKSLPLVPPHYVRQNSTRLYVEGKLNQSRAYKLYCSYALAENQRPVSKPVYVKHLNALNVSFHQPRKDRCWCTDFHEWSEADQAESQEVYDLHIQRKDRARSEKSMDEELSKNDQTIMTVCFDLQAILFSPMLYNKQIYYKYKLASFNLTVYIIYKKEGHCYFWDEVHAKKGSIEVSSCILKFILHEVPCTIHTLILYADNCPGQNKNSVLLAMLIYALHAHPSLQVIKLKFLEVGHTWQQADSVHSVINRASKKEQIFVPADWQKVTRHAKQDGRPYIVHDMSQESFLDFKAYRDEIDLEKLKDTDGHRIKWRDVRFAEIRKSSPQSIFVKTDYDLEFRQVRLQPTLPLPGLNQNYNELLPITHAKYKDLRDLCTAHVISQIHHRYYQNLPHTKKAKGKQARVDNDDNEETERFGGRGVMPGMFGQKH